MLDRLSQGKARQGKASTSRAWHAWCSLPGSEGRALTGPGGDVRTMLPKTRQTCDLYRTCGFRWVALVCVCGVVVHGHDVRDKGRT
jgi:hypothetical protein